MKQTDLSTPEYYKYHRPADRDCVGNLAVDQHVLRVKNDENGRALISELKQTLKAVADPGQVRVMVRGRAKNRNLVCRLLRKKYNYSAGNENDFYLNERTKLVADYWSVYITVIPASKRIEKSLNLERFVKVDAPSQGPGTTLHGL